MVPLTMYLLRYGVIEPILTYGYSFALGEKLVLQLPFKLFNLLILINVLLGAAGYVINDYFDRKIDSINRPNDVIVGNTIHRRFAIILHFTLDALAILLAGYLSWYFRKPFVLIIYLMIAGIFWLYSTTYKKQFLIGNIIVALGTAMIPLQLAYFEILALIQTYGQEMIVHGLTFKVLFYWLAAFGLFAFLTNLIREIIKDLEDFEGDSSYGCNTLPITLGVRASKITIIALSTFTIALLAYFYHNFIMDPISKWYLLFFVAIPMILVSIFTIRAKTAKNFYWLSQAVKVIMLMGILYAGVAYYLIEFIFNM
jgi:4-hydroxybenzoate polyprenyltransferase